MFLKPFYWSLFGFVFVLFERESKSTHTGELGRGRGRGTERVLGSTPSLEPDSGLDLTTVRSRPEPKSRVGYLTDRATQAPQLISFCVSVNLDH